MSQVNNEVIDEAIDNIESIISVMIKDMAMGASYVRNNSSQCIDMIMLKRELETRKEVVKIIAPAKVPATVKLKAQAKKKK